MLECRSAGLEDAAQTAPCEAVLMGSLQRIAPIFAVHDLDVAMAHYRQLGFAVRAYRGGGYGFASRDGVEIHLGVVPADDRRVSSATCSSMTPTTWHLRGFRLVWTFICRRTPSGASMKAPLSTPMAMS